jgi:hypothetical protein
MTWKEHHSRSEQLANIATSLVKNGQIAEAIDQYRLAAAAEVAEIAFLDPIEQQRTLGITVTSAVALYFKGKELSQSKKLAYQWLATETLPSFAIQELEVLLREILTVESYAVPTAV